MDERYVRMQQFFLALEMIISPNFPTVEIITPVLGHFGTFGLPIVLEHKRHMTTSARPTANL